MKKNALKYTQLSLYCILCGFFYLMIFRHSFETAASTFYGVERILYKSIGLFSLQLSLVVAALVPAIINVFVSSFLLKFRNGLISLICGLPIVFCIGFVQAPEYWLQALISGLLISSIFTGSGMLGGVLLRKVRSPLTYLNKNPLPEDSSPFYFFFILYIAIALYLLSLVYYGLFKGMNPKFLLIFIFSLFNLGALLLAAKERISGRILVNLLNVGSIVAAIVYYSLPILFILGNIRMLPWYIFILLFNTVCYFNRARLTGHSAWLIFAERI